MNLSRFYCESITGPRVELTGQQAHHLSSVRRLSAGDKVELFDGKGCLARAVIDSAKSKKVTLTVEKITVVKKQKTARVIIAVSCPKGERFDWLLAKCTELGVDRIVPVNFERTVKQPKNPKIMTRWKNITIESAKQCKRLFLPQIDLPLNLKEAVEILKNDYPKGKFLLGSLDPNCKSVLQQKVSADTVAIIGPEGGITQDEQDFFINENFSQVRLTDTILRIETAAIAFASVLTALRDNDNK